MDLVTQTHLKSLRAALESRLNELRTNLHAAAHARLTEPAASHEVNDRQDLAEERTLAIVVDEGALRDIEEEGLVVAALARLDQGTYGDCQHCGEVIAWPRLLVQPAAARCATCQAVWEHAQELSRPRGQR